MGNSAENLNLGNRFRPPLVFPKTEVNERPQFYDGRFTITFSKYSTAACPCQNMGINFHN